MKGNNTNTAMQLTALMMAAKLTKTNAQDEGDEEGNDLLGTVLPIVGAVVGVVIIICLLKACCQQTGRAARAGGRVVGRAAVGVARTAILDTATGGAYSTVRTGVKVARAANNVRKGRYATTVREGLGMGADVVDMDNPMRGVRSPRADG